MKELNSPWCCFSVCCKFGLESGLFSPGNLCTTEGQFTNANVCTNKTAWSKLTGFPNEGRHGGHVVNGLCQLWWTEMNESQRGNLKTQAVTFRQIQGKGQQLEPQLKDRGQTEHSDGDKQTNKQTNPVQIRHDFDNSDIQFKPGQTRWRKKKSHTQETGV